MKFIFNFASSALPVLPFLNITAISPTTIRMSWQPLTKDDYDQSTEALLKFRVEYKSKNQSRVYSIDDIAPNSLLVDVSCLDPNTEYQLRVCREFFILQISRYHKN